MTVEIFNEYLAAMPDPQQRARLAEVLDWIEAHFPALGTRIGWNQPMFTDHGTFIIGFNTSKKHLLIAPEVAAIEHFSGEIIAAGYDHTKGLFRIKWESPVDYGLLERIIRFNIADKAACETFWRK